MAVTGGWTVRYALAALMVVVAVGIVEGLVVNTLVGPGALRTGIKGIIFDATMLACLIPLYRRRPFHARDLGLRRSLPASSVGWVTLAVVLVAITNLVWLQGVLGLKLHNSLGIALRGSTLGRVVAGVFISFLAPVTEEIFFRGLLYRALRNRMAIAPAAVIAGLVFGAVHGLSFPLDTLPPRAVFGIIACLLYERTGSLLPGIALHCLVDASGFETAISSHDIVFPAFLALALVLLLYAGGRRMRERGELAFLHSPSASPGSAPPD